MYVAVRRYEGVRDPQKVAQLGEESFVPIISEMPGFVAHYLVDAGDGVMGAVSFFEHKDAEEQSTFRAGEFVQEHEPTLLPNPPQVTAGEVVNYKAKSEARDGVRELDVRELGLLTAPALPSSSPHSRNAWKKLGRQSLLE